MTIKVALVDPTTREFLEYLNAQGDADLNKLSLEDARAGLSKLQAGPVWTQSADIEDHTLPVGPTETILIRIVRPKSHTAALPVIMYFHGGGWVSGDRNTHDRLVREFAHGATAAVVFVEYSRSPEVKYPIAIEECYAATQYIVENGQRFNIDATRLAVAGESSGANIAAVVTLMAKQRKGPRIGFQVLFSPTTDANFDTPSFQEFATDHFLTGEQMKWFWNQYLPEEAARRQPTASPLQASVDQLTGLPPALVITGECDILRDQGEAYAHKLMEAGVPVTAVRYLGAIHVFMLLNALAKTPAARAAIDLSTSMLKHVFVMRGE
jgi:acetyl esterase